MCGEEEGARMSWMEGGDHVSFVQRLAMSDVIKSGSCRLVVGVFGGVAWQ